MVFAHEGFHRVQAFDAGHKMSRAFLQGVSIGDTECLNATAGSPNCLENIQFHQQSGFDVGSENDDFPAIAPGSAGRAALLHSLIPSEIGAKTEIYGAPVRASTQE
jgi:hypothetical protein